LVTMWAAPAVAKRSLLALLAATVTLCAAVPVASAKTDVSQSAAAAPDEIWAVEVGRTSIPLLDESFAELLEFAKVNTLIVDSRRVTRAQFDRARAFAVKWQLTLISPHARTPTSKKKLKKDVARAVGSCRALARRSTTEPCVVLARTRAAAFALASRSEVDVVLTRVSGPAGVRSLNRGLSRRVTAARVIALPPLRDDYSFSTKTWSRAVDAAAYSLALDVAPSLTSAKRPTLLRLSLLRYSLVVVGSRQARLLNSAPTPPAPPSGLSLKSAAGHSITVTWSPAAPADGVVGYLLHVNDSRAGVTALRTATISGLSCGTTHRVELVAANRIGNQSSRANLSASTAACGSRPSPAPKPAPAPKPKPSHPTAPATPPISSPIGPQPAPAPPVTPTPAPAPVPPPPSAGQAYVSPSGSDANPCTASQPCLSFGRAYKVVASGGVVQIAGGTYAGQIIAEDPAKTGAPVTFEPAAGALVTVSGMLDVGQDQFKVKAPRNIVLRNLRATSEIRIWSGSSGITVENADANNFMIVDASDITIRGGDFGPCVAGPGVSCVSKIAGPLARNIVIEDALFHDISSSNPDLYHIECMFLRSGTNVTIRRNKFQNCEVFDLFIQGQPEVDKFSGILIENNWFDAPLLGSGARRMSAISVNGSKPVENLVLRNNSFSRLAGPMFDDNTPLSNVRVVGNLFLNGRCPSRSGVVFAYNLFVPFSAFTGQTPCGATDKRVDSFGYVNADGFDYSLTASSPARDAGSPSDYPGTDIDGKARPSGARADAGAVEAG
jgi:hypothetical protein